MSRPRVLVTGAEGQLGSTMLRTFADAEVLAHTRRSLDVTNATAVAEVVAAARPTLIINCAAFNDVDGAEDRPEEALAVNAFALRSLARAADRAGATLVHYSSDFVFDGSARQPYNEASAPTPRSVYAASKLLGEWFGLEARRGFVLRVESLFGMPASWNGRLGTLDTLVRAMMAGREVRAFTDRIVSPSYVEDVAVATRALVAHHAAPGLYHCVNSGHASWHDVVTLTAGVLGLSPSIVPMRTDQVKMRALRPTYCALDNAKLRSAGHAMPTWQDAIARWVRELRAVAS